MTNDPESTDAESTDPDGKDPDSIYISGDAQLRAIANHTRHRVLRILRDGPATITQIAERLGIAKGSSNHHVKVLAKAGLVAVVETRKVGGVIEQYYAMTGKRIELPEPVAGQPETLMRHALADVEEAPPNEQKRMLLKHARLSPEAWEEFNERITALVEELHEASDPSQAAADLFIAFYRPKDV